MTSCLLCLENEKDRTKMCNLDKIVSIEDNLKFSIRDIIYLVTTIKLECIKQECYLCTICVTEAIQAYKFKQKCVSAEQRHLDLINFSNDDLNINLIPNIKIEPSEDDNIVVSETSVSCEKDVKQENIMTEEATHIEDKEILDPSQKSDATFPISPGRMKLMKHKLAHALAHGKNKGKVKKTKQLEGTSSTKYTCEICERTFNKKSVLDSHMGFVHPTFASNVEYPQHHQYISIITPALNIRKQDINDDFHIKIEEKEDDNTNPSETFTSYEEDAKEENKSKADGKNKGKVRRAKPLEGTSIVPQYICGICDRTFNLKSGLDSHIGFVHPTFASDIDYPHTCPKCPKKFKFLSQMNRHVHHCSHRRKATQKFAWINV